MMSTHNSDYSTERFSMGKLQGPELAEFEQHLLLCDECQAAVRAIDRFPSAFGSAAEHLRQREGSAEPRLSAPTRFKGKYLLVQAALPNTNIENIGILLLDADSDRLYCRFRRDFEEFPGAESDWFRRLPDAVSTIANELGGIGIALSGWSQRFPTPCGFPNASAF